MNHTFLSMIKNKKKGWEALPLLLPTARTHMLVYTNAYLAYE